MPIEYVLHTFGLDNDFVKNNVHTSLTREQHLELFRRFNALPAKRLKLPLIDENMMQMSSILDEITSFVDFRRIEFTLDDRKHLTINDDNVEQFIKEMVKVAHVIKKRNMKQGVQTGTCHW